MNIVPGSRTMNRGQLLALPHKQAAVRLARNLGYLVPAPIVSHYDWGGHSGDDTPFKTQKITAALLTMQRRAYVLSQMGTGKTRAALYAIDWMLMQGDIRAVLVVAPLSTLSQVWDREVYQYFNHLSVGVLHGNRTKREKVLAQDHHIYVINHDGIKVISKQLQAKEELDCIVVDELAVFRNKSSDRWKELNAVIHDRPYVWGLTGAPTPNEPVDAFAQVKLLTPSRVPTYIKAFRRKTMRQISTFKWVPLSDANDTVYEAMQPAVRYKRDDCVELPPLSYQAREAPMTKKQKEVYKRLMIALIVMFDKGEVTAANEGVLFSKLLQIASGWVYTREKDGHKKVVSLDNTPRIDQLVEVLDEADGKVIVFAEFTHTAKAVQEILAKRTYDTVLVTGATSKTARDQIFGDFQNAESPRIIVAHPKCMSHGLTLTAASVICWFTPTTSLETYEQANARISRPGQTRKQLIIHLTGSPIETKLYRRLQQKKSLQGALLEMFEEH
jgi:SNF2 family DNA or RNA helicase